MKTAAALIATVLLTVSAQAALRNLERFTVSGSDYVRLAEWGASAGCAMKWNKRDGEVDVSGPSTRLNFSIDSRRAEISGVSVWLCLPVGNYEKKYTLLLAQEAAELLKKQGFKVVMTRTKDEAVELSDRPQWATRHA